MKPRKIIRIDEALCNGCGECITTCAEGALKLVNGKARLVSETFCDGFGDCIGQCPTGALTVETRQAAAFDFEATREHVARVGGVEAVRRLEQAAKTHDAGPDRPAAGPSALRSRAGGCPSSRFAYQPPEPDAKPVGDTGPAQAIPSELRQWPVQLHLVQPGAPFFRDRELVILSTCGPVASADVHWRFLRGRATVVACPKLDDTSPYVQKLAAILREPSIPQAIVVRMEVPCCGGLTEIARQAAALSGRTDLALREVTLRVNGDVASSEPIGAAPADRNPFSLAILRNTGGCQGGT